VVQGAVFVGVIAPVAAFVILLAVIGAWRRLREVSGEDATREQHRWESDLMRRESRLRRQRNIRLGRFESEPRDAPGDPEEGVRVIQRDWGDPPDPAKRAS
jgi:hypothetical protein